MSATGLCLLVRMIVLPDGREGPVASGYRPDWAPAVDRDIIGCASVLVRDDEVLTPGQAATVLLEPLVPQFWRSVQEGDVLVAFEGSLAVAQAKVVAVYGRPYAHPIHA